MSVYFLAGFMLLYGINVFLAVNIPNWAFGALAILAGLTLLWDKHGKTILARKAAVEKEKLKMAVEEEKLKDNPAPKD